MAARVAGALLALTAAALLSISLLLTPWWQGHPTFNGAEIKAKEITISPLGATGCNVGGDGECMSVPVDATFETVGFALTGVAGLLAVLALVLAILAFRGAPRAKSIAVFIIVGAMIAAGLAIVLVVLGPQVRTEAPLPFAFGLYIFLGAIASVIAGSTLAMRIPNAAPHLQLAPPRQSMPQMQPAPNSPNAGVDVQSLLANEALRPSTLGPEPKLGRGSPVVQSPGGALPGPSGPLGAIGNHSGAQPLFSSAPNLRPLYEANPAQGGTAGFVPQPPPHLPLAPPTPVPRDQISAHAGIPTPASIASERPITFAAKGAPPPPTPAPPNLETERDLLGTVRGAGTPKEPPKPLAAKPLPPPGRGAKIRESLKASSIAPIPSLAASRPAVPLPVKPLLVKGSAATLASAVVPPPPNPTLASRDSDNSEVFDAMKTYQQEPSPRKSAPRPATPRPPTRLATEDVALDTDVSTPAIDEHARATESFETSTGESTSFAQKPRPPTFSATMETAPAPGDEDSLVQAMPKLATDIDLPTVRPPTETAPTTPPAPDPAPAADQKAKLPLSTAPQSLPPPSEKQAMTSGPSPACPQCEAPMAWVEAHLRFYCKSCKMYF